MAAHRRHANASLSSAVKRTNSLCFRVACNSAECIPLPATGRLFRIATISIYSGVIDCCYRLIQPSLSSIFSSPTRLSFPLSLSLLFIRSIYSKAKRFRPASEKVYTPPLSPNSEAFSSWISLFAISTFFDRLSPLPSVWCHHTRYVKLTFKRILLPFRIVFEHNVHQNI